MKFTRMNNLELWQKNRPPLCGLSFSELETHLNFQYLPKLRVPKDIQEACLTKYKSGAVASEHLETGSRFKEEIAEGKTPHVSVRFCGEEIGWGLFAEEDLPENFFVGEYTGEVRKNNQYTLSNYLYEYPIPDTIGRNHVIDATSGNLMRFVNHCSLPNLKPFYAFSEGLYHLILVTQRPILKGEQLTYDYGQNYWYVRTPPID